MACVFVYGTLKRGYHNHHILEGSRFIGEAVLRMKARMICVGFPVLLKDHKCRMDVYGEIYEVNRATMIRLDQLEGNGRMYQRKRRKVTGTWRVWVYFGVPEFWAQRPYSRKVESNVDGLTVWAQRMWEDEEDWGEEDEDSDDVQTVCAQEE